MGGTKKDQDIETETKDIKTMFYINQTGNFEWNIFRANGNKKPNWLVTSAK